jgi:hypothetical protein
MQRCGATEVTLLGLRDRTPCTGPLGHKQQLGEDHPDEPNWPAYGDSYGRDHRPGAGLENLWQFVRQGKRMADRMIYPNLFRLHREKAEALLASGVDDNVIYACLELRMCLEAYAYWQLSHYVKQASFDLVQRTWQPSKVIKELRAIDPTVTESSSVLFHRDGKRETSITVVFLL